MILLYIYYIIHIIFIYIIFYMFHTWSIWVLNLLNFFFTVDQQCHFAIGSSLCGCSSLEFAIMPCCFLFFLVFLQVYNVIFRIWLCSGSTLNFGLCNCWVSGNQTLAQECSNSLARRCEAFVWFGLSRTVQTQQHSPLAKMACQARSCSHRVLQ